jgi:ankyrin repeat protein
VGLAVVFGIAFFANWKRGGEDATIDAIVRGDWNAYQAATKRRSSGNINNDLWLAARWGRKQFVESLLKQGANPNSRLTGSTALEAATENLGRQPNGNAEVTRTFKTRSNIADLLENAGALIPGASAPRSAWKLCETLSSKTTSAKSPSS